MSNPNWRTKGNHRVFVRFENTTCKICRDPLEVGQRIMPYAKSWICVPCWNAENPAKDIEVIEAPPSVRNAGWEYDKNHQPHSMSVPCDRCDHLFGHDSHLSLVLTTPPSSP